MNYKFLNITILFFLTTVFAHSQDAENIEKPLVTEIEEIVISATRTKRQLSSLPLPVTLVSQKKIAQSGSVRLNEILSEQTGIITVADRSGFEGIQIQGMESDYVLILIDGVPLIGRSSGNFNLERLTVGNIKQIEVVKGPSSSLYGSEAMGGVVNIITEKPETKKLSGNSSYRIGSFTEQDLNLGIEQSFKKLRYAFFANRFSSEGYDLNSDTQGNTVDPFENYTVNGRIYYDFNDKISLFSSTRFYHQLQNSELITEESIYRGDNEENDLNTQLKLDHLWNEKFNATYEFYYTNYKASEKLTSVNAPTDILNDSFFDQKLLRPEIRATYTFNNNSKLTSGVGFQYDLLDRTYFDDKVDFSSQYVYSQYDFNVLDRINIIAGARFDNHSEYSNQFSPKLAFRFKITNEFAFKTSIGYGYKAPDFRQLYFDFTNSTVGYTVLGYNVAVDKLKELETQGQIQNITVEESELQDPLQAESSIGYNAGFTFKRGKWNTEINLFRNDRKNFIDTRVIARKANGQNVFSYVNVDESYTTGIEFNSSFRVLKNINISGGYQLLYAYDKTREEEVENGEVFVRNPETLETVALESSDYFGLPNRSRHNANFKVFYDIPSIKGNINLRLLYRSKYGQFDTNGNNIIDNYDTSFVDGFVTTNIAASKTFYDDFTLQAGANNLFDHTDANIPALPGIQAFIKLNYQF